MLDDGPIRAVEQWLGRKIEFVWEVTEPVVVELLDRDYRADLAKLKAVLEAGR